MALGWGVSRLYLPHAPWEVHLFIGATLCATSVGITARVLRDLGWLHRTEAQIILGAAVIDDVMGLVILAVVSGVISAAAGGGPLAAGAGAGYPGEGVRLPGRGAPGGRVCSRRTSSGSPAS